jgi:hypothetical protein
VDVELLVDVLVGRYKRQVSAPDHVNNPHGRYTRVSENEGMVDKENTIICTLRLVSGSP